MDPSLAELKASAKEKKRAPSALLLTNISADSYVVHLLLLEVGFVPLNARYGTFYLKNKQNLHKK